MTPELAERLGLNQQVMNDLVMDAVIVQGAEHEGVRYRMTSCARGSRR